MFSVLLLSLAYTPRSTALTWLPSAQVPQVPQDTSWSLNRFLECPLWARHCARPTAHECCREIVRRGTALRSNTSWVTNQPPTTAYKDWGVWGGDLWATGLQESLRPNLIVISGDRADKSQVSCQSRQYYKHLETEVVLSSSDSRNLHASRCVTWTEPRGKETI